MKRKEVDERKLNLGFALTLGFMDLSPVIEKVTKMKPEQIEALPPREREELKKAVLDAINAAKEKAERIVKEVETNE